MADPINNLLKTPLTPEQEALMRRGVVNPSWGPMDFIGPGIGAAAGYGTAKFAQHLAGVTNANAPLWLRALMGGGGAAYGAANMQYINRNGPPESMDAEAQPGGFYGPPINNLLRGY